MPTANRIFRSLTLGLAILVFGCSGFGQGKKVDPAVEAAEAALVPCDMPCCCKRVDGYYVRYTCTDAESCAAKHGECLPADTRECRS